MQDEIQTCLDEIFGVPPQMKSNPPNRTLQSKISPRSDFIHVSGFIPQKADLVEKDSELYPILSLFLVRETGLEPVRKNTRPSNVRVCRFRHSRGRYIIILQRFWFVKRFLKNIFS